ncbi:regulator of G-protein signaling 9 [Leptosomus discolor]
MCTLTRGAPWAPPERRGPLTSSILHLLASAMEPQAEERGRLLVRLGKQRDWVGSTEVWEASSLRFVFIRFYYWYDLSGNGRWRNLDPCHLASWAPHPTVYAGTSTPPSLPPGPPALPHSPACPSPISVALDSTTGAEREQEPEGAGPDPFPSGGGRSRMAALSFGRFLKRGCWTSPVFTTLSPKCPAVPHGKVQPLGEREQRLRPDAKAVSSFFQIKMDTPLESRIYPIDSQEGEDNRHRARKDSAKEVICPWENPMEEGRAG